MPIPAYAWFTGTKSGQMKGSVTISGREGSSEVMEFDHQEYIPADNVSSKLTGTRVHEPIKLVKSFDSASPMLYQACCNGETLSEVTVKWYQIDVNGRETQYFTHTLKNAKVAGVRAS